MAKVAKEQPASNDGPCTHCGRPCDAAVGACDLCLLTRRVVPPEPRRSTRWAAQDERRARALVAFAALEGDDELRAAMEPDAAWSIAQRLAAVALDARTAAVAECRASFGDEPARWPGRWRRVRALRVAWAMGDVAARVATRVAPCPTAALLGDVEELAGRDAACALRHPEAIGDVGPLAPAQAARVAMLCAIIARRAEQEARDAPAEGSARADEQGALRDAVVDLLHAAAPLAAAGDEAARLAMDLASALRAALAIAGSRRAAGDSADAADAGPPGFPELEPDAGRERIARAMLNVRADSLAPFAGLDDPFASGHIGPRWRPSARADAEWMDGWRTALLPLPASWGTALRAGAAFVVIAEGRGWGPVALGTTFADALRECRRVAAELPRDASDDSMILCALPALGWNPRKFTGAAETDRQRAGRRNDFLRDEHGNDRGDEWRRRRVREFLGAKGNDSKAVAMLQERKSGRTGVQRAAAHFGVSVRDVAALWGVGLAKRGE